MMFPRIASAYDQNPARIQHIARLSRRKDRTSLPTFIGIQLLVGLAAVLLWNYLPL